MATVEKKKPRKKRSHHPKAIATYKQWLADNPNAKRKRRIKQFDICVDSALLEECLDREI